jgi:c(7)-type cytochrome triheme protein
MRRVIASLFGAFLLTACETRAPVPASDQTPPESAAEPAAPAPEALAAPAPVPEATTPTPAEAAPTISARKRSAPPAAPRISAKSRSYDPSGPGFPLLQAPQEALRGLPVDRNGKVDWVRSLDSNLISPRADLYGKARMQTLDLDILMKRTKDMPWVLFPHRPHSEWLACANCHPRPFVAKSGANQINMESIMRGEHCGTCHDKVAFSTFLCERCHSVPHAGSPPAWW